MPCDPVEPVGPGRAGASWTGGAFGADQDDVQHRWMTGLRTLLAVEQGGGAGAVRDQGETLIRGPVQPIPHEAGDIHGDEVRGRGYGDTRDLDGAERGGGRLGESPLHPGAGDRLHVKGAGGAHLVDEECRAGLRDVAPGGTGRGAAGECGEIELEEGRGRRTGAECRLPAEVGGGRT